MPVLDLFRLDGRTALVTGARRGIGRAIAIALAEAGADILAVSQNMEPDGGTLGEEIRTLGRGFRAEACDLSSRAAVQNLLGKLLAEGPAIGILVNNAGSIRRAPAAVHSDDDWGYVIHTNLHAPWLLARALGARMLERRSGKIIFTASLLSFQGGITVPGYSASKGAIAQLTKALANEWAPHNVQVNAIAPGYIVTDNTAALRADLVRNSAILARIPAGRWGDPADIAGAAVFLASSASNYVNGEILVVDGGWMGR
jgi:2-dehydro-3-deoxy-D-gluconate 5-dehydrogenase